MGLPDRTMLPYDVVLSYGGIMFGSDVGWRGSEAELFASTSSMTQQGLGDVTHGVLVMHVA
jgi:hypothetical protein